MVEKEILIIGYGGAGKRFAENVWRYGKGVKLDVINTSARKVEQKSEKYPIYDAENYETEKQYDAIIIAVPTSEHLNYFEKWKDHSDIFLIEKPIDSDFGAIERVSYELLNSEKKVFVNFQKRYKGSWKKAKEIIESGRLGAFEYGTVSVRSDMRKWRDKDYKSLYAARKDLGGGALLTECHEIDAANWMLGDITEVAGVRNYNCKELDVDDSVSFIGKINGKPVSYQIDMLSDRIESKMEWKFEKGVVTVDSIANQVKCIEGKVESVFSYGEEDFNAEALKAFLNYIVDGTMDECLADFEQAQKVSAVCETLNNYSDSSFHDVELSIFPQEGAVVIHRVVEEAKKVFGTKLIAIYGMGSLGYGGYVNGWSDLDIDIIVDCSYEEARELFYKGKEIEKEIQKDGYDRIDIRTYNHIHLNERKTILSFGQCCRAVMLIDSSKLIYGTDISGQIIRPEIKEMNQEALGLCRIFFEKNEEYWDTLPWDDIAAFYALIARFIYTSKTGEVAGKRVAIEYLIENQIETFPEESRMWFVWAYALRLGSADTNLLLQDCFKIPAVKVLRQAFEVVYDILMKENREND